MTAIVDVNGTIIRIATIIRRKKKGRNKNTDCF